MCGMDMQEECGDDGTKVMMAVAPEQWKGEFEPRFLTLIQNFATVATMPKSSG